MTNHTINVKQSSFRRGERDEKFFGVKVSGEFQFADKILEVMDKTTAKILSLGGFYIMDDARKSIRDAGKKGDPAKPGRPPKSVIGYLKQFIDFQFDPSTRSVVVGPRGLDKPASAKIAPRALEEGGETIGFFTAGTWIDDETGKPLFGANLRERLRELKRAQRARSRSSFDPNDPGPELPPMHQLQRSQKISLTIQPHPYMQPSFQKNIPKINRMWANSIKA